MSERKIHVRGPLWYARCDQCGEHLSTEFEDEARNWEHVCDLPTDPGEIIHVTFGIARDFTSTPTVNFHGARGMSWPFVRELGAVARDVDYRFHGEDMTMKRAVQEGHERRRAQEADRIEAQIEDFTRRPVECPGCGSRFTTRGVRNHMRACHKVDPFAFKRGEYDNALKAAGA